MKKIVVFLLIVALCVPTLFACKPKEEPQNGPMQQVAKMYSVSQPTKVVAKTTQLIGSLELNCDYSLTTGLVDNAKASVYVANMEEVRSVEEGGQNEEIKDIIKSYTRVVESIEGKGTRTNGGDWKESGEVWSIGRGTMALNLDETAVTNIKYENHVLTFTVPKANAAKVLGEEYAKDISSDVMVKIVDDGAVVTSVELHYNLAGNPDINLVESVMSVKVDYTYDIEKITIE